MSQLIEYTYQNHIIEFDASTDNVMVNATEMAKIFDKKVEAFMRNEQTKAFIDALLKNANQRFISEENNGNSRYKNRIKSENSRFLEDGNSENYHFLGDIKKDNSPFTESDLYTSKQKSGTWMHRVLALKFAAWLDPEFEVWVFTTIDQILFGEYYQLKEEMEKTARRKIRMEELEAELSENEAFVELEDLKKEERRASYRRGKIIKKKIKLFEGRIDDKNTGNG